MPVGDDPPTPVPSSAERSTAAAGLSLGDDADDRTAMVPSLMAPRAAPAAPETDASATLSGEEDDNPFSPEKTSIVGDEPDSPSMPSPAITPVGPLGATAPAPTQTANPWSERDSTGATTLSGPDVARRPTQESPLAALSKLTGKPVVWISAGGALILLLIVAVVLLTRPAVPAGSSIVEVKQPPTARTTEPPPAPPTPKPAPDPEVVPAPSANDAPEPPEEPQPTEPARAEVKPQKGEPKSTRTARRAAVRTAELRVVTTQKGKNVVARVSIDGADKGHTPLAVQLAPGKHEVSVARPKGAPVTRTVKLVGDKPTVLKIDLPD